MLFKSIIVTICEPYEVKQEKLALDVRSGPLISVPVRVCRCRSKECPDPVVFLYSAGVPASGITDRSSDWRTLAGWKRHRRRTQQRHWRRGSRPVTVLISLLLAEHSQVRWLAVSSVYQSASLAGRLAALKCHISTVMNRESKDYSQTSPLLRPH